MTEEIIIDGVDVAGCCYYESKNDTGKWCDLTCTRDNAPVFRCENMPNCYYKQLIRLEQENRELKEKYTHVLELAKTNADSNEYCLQELEKENEQLRSALEEIKHILEIHKDELEECLHNDIDGIIQNKINEVLK